jgi:hypothetical protein
MEDRVLVYTVNTSERILSTKHSRDLPERGDTKALPSCIPSFRINLGIKQRLIQYILGCWLRQSLFRPPANGLTFSREA